MWYVVQVMSGREDAAIDMMHRCLGESAYAEAFAPRYRAMRKVDGQWQAHEELLTPGYIIVDTQNPDALEVSLRRVPAFTRLLGGEEGFVPLDRQERAWIEQWTKRGNRVIGPSTATVERGRVRILSGPLLGREGDLVQVNRRKSEATIRMKVMGRTKEVKLTLQILGKPPTTSGASR